MSAPSLCLRGSITALATPFRGVEIDAEAFVALCDRQIRCGTSALVVNGSTGEAASLRPHELAEMVRLAVELVRGRIPVVAGVGGACTESAALIAHAAAKAGADALLCAPTPYVKPSQEGFMAHICTLACHSDLPVVLYDVPGRSGVAIGNETVARLRERGIAIGLKDATADLARPPRLRALCGPDFAQLSGDDATAAAYRAAGGHGCVSVTANVVPALCAGLQRAWDEGDRHSFARLRDLLSPLHQALFAETNPIPLKGALSALGLAEDSVRLPLVAALPATRSRLAEILPVLMEQEDALARQAAEALPA